MAEQLERSSRGNRFHGIVCKEFLASEHGRDHGQQYFRDDRGEVAVLAGGEGRRWIAKSYCFAPITFTSTATPSLAPILKLKSISPMPSGNKNRLSPAGGLESDSSCSRTSLNAVEIVAAGGGAHVRSLVGGWGRWGGCPAGGAGRH